jgi:hypothetical protein
MSLPVRADGVTAEIYAIAVPEYLLDMYQGVAAMD